MQVSMKTVQECLTRWVGDFQSDCDDFLHRYVCNADGEEEFLGRIERSYARYWGRCSGLDGVLWRSHPDISRMVDECKDSLHDILKATYSLFLDKKISLNRLFLERPDFGSTTQAVELVLVPTLEISDVSTVANDWYQTSIDDLEADNLEHLECDADSQGIEQPQQLSESTQTIEFTHLGKKGEYLANDTYSWPIGSRFRPFKLATGLITLSIVRALNQSGFIRQAA